MNEGGSSEEEWEQQNEEEPPSTNQPAQHTTPTKVEAEEEKAPVKIPTPTKVSTPEKKEPEPQYPSREWMLRWKETLMLGNIKQCIQHTYSKAMNFRNQMIEVDSSYSANQIVNIDEDALAKYLLKFSLKGLLPTMPKILVTTYRGN